jgi:glc operon protein GlcG
VHRKEKEMPSPPPAPPFGAPITCEMASKVVESCMGAADRLVMPMAIAVVEPTGDLVYFARMSGAPYSAIELAQQKAIVAARYRRPTEAFFDSVEGGHLFFLTFPGIVAVPGGAPLLLDGKIVGAVGVSGGNGKQDVEVCNAGIAALGLKDDPK